MSSLCAIIFPHYPALAARLALRSGSERHDLIAIERHGSIIASTPEARAMGIGCGMTVTRVRALQPSVLILQRDAAMEQAVWETILARVHETTPLMVSPRLGLIHCGMDRPAQVRGILHDTYGQGGRAMTQTLALLAAAIAEPGRTMTVPRDGTAQFLAAWKTSNLRVLGYSDELVERLRLFGLSTMAHVQHLTRRHLHAQFGAEGHALHDLLHSVSDRTELSDYNPPPVIVTLRRFDDAEREPAALLPVMTMLVGEAWTELAGRHATTVEVQMLDRADNVIARSSRILVGKVQWSTTLLMTAAKTLLQDLLDIDRWCSGLRLKLMGLLQPPVMQATMFRPRPCIGDVIPLVLRRYPHGLRRIVRVDADAYLPEQAVLLSYYDRDGDSA